MRPTIPANFRLEDDEEGGQRVLAEAPSQRVPRLRVLARLDENACTRRHAYRASKHCIHCAMLLAGPDEGHVVPTTDGIRLACRGDCFAAALVTHAPEVRIVCAGGSTLGSVR